MLLLHCCCRLELEVEPFFAIMALYDIREKKKVRPFERGRERERERKLLDNVILLVHFV